MPDVPPAAVPAADRSRRRDLAVAAAVAHDLLDDEHPLIGLLDLQDLRERASALHAAFDEVTAPGQHVLHTFAVKAAALPAVLRRLAALGIGAEVASPGELALAHAAGLDPARIVLDSPAKTRTELRTALRQGIALNADNPQELDRLTELLATGTGTEAGPGGAHGPIGIRVNPQLGGGSIDAMSTATATSKFGVPLRDEGGRAWVLRAFAERPWLTRLHCHTGSQGIPLERMAAGVRATYELAEEINTAAGRRQIDTLDIGGGLPVHFGGDDTTPTFADYARLLRREVPGLFGGRYALVTEFGRSLLAKSGMILTRVEYTKTAGGRPIAVTHAGAQVATRTVFAPDAWPIRVAAYDAKGRPKTGTPVRQDVAGPCCFAGDLVARDRALPPLAPGDLAALLDTGAYYFSTPFGYNSLPRPAVHGYEPGPDGRLGFTVLRRAQTLAEVVAEAGGDL
ncbi:type III PLP-dependent enzyme domain-containing protein [Streptomyces harbinensis]|uniref:Diaminopimelate decarboxylase n=1 Tax=Streptomyces harbinensis TaxID=1176198 RepID=A0A1I6VC98_9ACTN|nr:diaminopimelate decarboxylase [Streptomyces harbinensis]SFT11230.1 diaminopimelate decarboxylase [Streptomyces harbinensis]